VKRSSLNRSKPMARGKRIAARRATPRRSSYFADPAYLDFVRAQPCAIARHFELPAWCGPSEPDHQREGAGAGQKRPDPFAYPACRAHHECQHALTGVFTGFTRDARRAVVSALIAQSQRAFYGRALTEDDLSTVRAAVEAGVPTRGLLAATTSTAGAAGIEAAL
jgi:hypothetical protein